MTICGFECENRIVLESSSVATETKSVAVSDVTVQWTTVQSAINAGLTDLKGLIVGSEVVADYGKSGRSTESIRKKNRL